MFLEYPSGECSDCNRAHRHNPCRKARFKLCSSMSQNHRSSQAGIPLLQAKESLCSACCVPSHMPVLALAPAFFVYSTSTQLQQAQWMVPRTEANCQKWTESPFDLQKAMQHSHGLPTSPSKIPLCFQRPPLPPHAILGFQERVSKVCSDAATGMDMAPKHQKKVHPTDLGAHPLSALCMLPLPGNRMQPRRSCRDQDVTACLQELDAAYEILQRSGCDHPPPGTGCSPRDPAGPNIERWLWSSPATCRERPQA